MKNNIRPLVMAVSAAMVLAACAPAATPAPKPTDAPKPAAPAATSAPAPTTAPAPTAVPATKAPEPTAAPAAKPFVSWLQYDEKNEDPKADEAVGNAYYRKTIPEFNKAFEGKYKWVNQPQPFAKIQASLIAAVQAGGDVPDIVGAGSGSIPAYVKNGTVQDLTDWAKSQPWFASLDPAAVKVCSSPDGKLWCIPIAETPSMVFYWKDHFPNGYPKTADEFLKQAAELKKKNVYAITYFGSTAFDGNATGRYFWQVISSFGGNLDDGKGMMTLNTPANVKAVEFMRKVVAEGYSSESVFLGDFKEEEDLKGLDPKKPVAASFPTGIFGYRYIQPVKSPAGKQYGDKFDPTGGPMLEAIAAGDMKIAPMFVGGDGKAPGCNLGTEGFVIPKGAKNPDAAKAYINSLFDPKIGVEWVQKPGGGFPTSKILLADKAFDTPFYKQASEASAGLCRPWQGSLGSVGNPGKSVAEVIFNLIKGKDAKNADIAGVLQKAQDEFNKNVK